MSIDASKNGILNINKPQNMTSHDVVAIVRKKINIKKVGHTGTLDPMALGVLPICIGKATKIIEYLDLDMKEYRCTLRLGIATDTLDIWGSVISERAPVGIKEEDIKNAIESFTGLVSQVPPMYSALKVDGKRLYQYARENQQVEIKSRKIYISNISINNIDLSSNEVDFTVECSKGTYIRSLCRDIGEKLDCDAIMSSLIRLKSGAFELSNTITIDELKAMDREDIIDRLIPLESPLKYFGEIIVNQDVADKISQGWKLPTHLCDILKSPYFKERDFFVPFRSEYKNMYCVYKGNILNMVTADNSNYLSSTSDNKLIAIMYYDETEKKYVSDKVFS